MSDSVKRMKMEATFGVDEGSLRSLVSALNGVDNTFEQMAKNFPDYMRDNVKKAMSILVDESVRGAKDAQRALAEIDKFLDDNAERERERVDKEYKERIKVLDAEQKAIAEAMRVRDASSEMLHERNIERWEHEARIASAAEAAKTKDTALAISMRDKLMETSAIKATRLAQERAAMHTKEAAEWTASEDRKWKEANKDAEQYYINLGRMQAEANDRAGALGMAGGFNGRQFMGSAIGGAGFGMAGGFMGGMMSPEMMIGSMVGTGVKGLYDKGVEGRDSDFAIKQLSFYMSEASEPADKLSDAVKRLGIAIGESIPSTVEALKAALSLGVPAGEVEGFVRAAKDLSLIKGTDVNSETQVLAGFKSSFGLDDKQTQALGDKFAVAYEKGHLSFGPGEEAGVAEIGNSMNMQPDQVLSALMSMTAKGRTTSQSVMALRQLMSRASNPTDKQMAAQGEAGFDFNADALRTYGPAGAVQRLYKGLGSSGVKLRSALGVDNNRGMLAAIDALLDKPVTDQMDAALAGSGGELSRQSGSARNSDKFSAERRGEQWSQIGQKIGRFLAAAGGAASQIGLTSLGVDTSNSDDTVMRALSLQKALTKSMFGGAGGSAPGFDLQGMMDSALKLQDLRDSDKKLKNLQAARTEWDQMAKTMDSVAKSTTATANADFHKLEISAGHVGDEILKWDLFIRKMEDTIQVRGDKQADVMAKRGSDYSTRTGTGNILSTYRQAKTSLGEIGAAGAKGDMGLLQKESARFSGFMGQLRGMDLTTVAKHGFDQRELDGFIEQTLDTEGVTDLLGRSRRSRELRTEARGFERDVKTKYNKFSSRPDIHKDADFAKWYSDKAMDRENKEESKTESGILEKAKGYQSKLADDAERWKDQLGLARDALVTIAETYRKIREEDAKIQDVGERMKAVHEHQGTIANAVAYLKHPDMTPEKLLSPGDFPAMTSKPEAPVINKTDVHVGHIRIEMPDGSTEDQAKKLARKLGMELQVEMDRGRLVLDNKR